MSIRAFVTLCFLSLFFLPGLLDAQSEHRALRQGDRQYDKKEYSRAQEAYELAGNGPKAMYNTGNALYRQGKYAEAADLFTRSTELVTEADKKADAFHNLGNAHLQQQQFGEAVEAYKNSLRSRPGDPDSKMNLQLAMQKLQEQQQQQNQNQQQPSGQPQNKDEENKEQQQQAEQEQQDQQQQQQQAQNPQKLSPEEARRLLESAVAPEDMKNARKYRKRGLPPPPPGVKEDW